ncbi:MAG TPA: hypothetical protein VNL91_02365 [Thermoanaerobaculia bacterium]|nr:hypothetical protein [Thermoanaerobaculia bacterium]
MRRTLILSLYTLLSVPLAADHTGRYANWDRILIPFARLASPLPGENGSLWTVHVMARNNSNAPMFITTDPLLPGEICVQCRGPFAPGETADPSSATMGLGQFIYAERAADVSLAVRVQDVSRQAQTWGTSVPVVRESDVFTGPLTLLDVPVTPEFRVALRVYDFDLFDGREVKFRLIDSASGVLLADTRARLSAGFNGDHRMVGRVPPTFSIGNLVAEFPQIIAASRIHIAIEPMTPGLRFWAFVSVTNNETQHVTALLP